MTTWFLLYERRRGSKSWTLTCNGGDGGLGMTEFSSERRAVKAQALRLTLDPEWETRVMKLEIPT